jgi:hypothetical protein
MSIRIESIDIKSLGPLQDFQHQLKDVNLVYGKNETGKTHLVEFLIRSLFKQTRYPGMRKLTGVGRVTVSGLADSPVYFSPSDQKKLEDFISGDGKVLPLNISRLLVVRGGELSLVDNHVDGIDRGILEEYLSNSGVINQVKNNIQKAIQNATITEGMVDGRKQGKIKDLYECKEELALIDLLMKRVNREYSTGTRASIESERKKLQEEFEQQEQARRHYAYEVKTKIIALEEKLNSLPEDLLHKTDIALHDYKKDSSNLGRLRKELEEERNACRELPWLQAAQQEYQRLIGERTSTVRSWQIILFVMLMVAAVVLVFLQQDIPAVILLAAASAMGIFSWYTSKIAAAHSMHNTEIEKIAADFKERFDQPLKNVAKLQAVLKEQEKAEITAENLERQVYDLENKIERLADSINDNLYQLTGDRTSTGEWEMILHDLVQGRKNIEKEHQALSNQLAGLQVDSRDYHIEPAPVAFDENRHRALQRQIEDLSEKLHNEEENLNSLRQSLAENTRQDISTSWEKLIETLQEKREEKVKEYKAISAEVIGGVLLTQTLDELFREEEKSIRQGLHSPNMSRFLEGMTTHYDRIEYENGAIRIADPYAEYAFSDLSTATQEQVLLALRLGFAARCFHDQSLFLVLDDAFQHSDWTRRGYLVDEVLHLAQKGWQIIYLTMDDHLRELFHKKASTYSGESFLEICL